MARRPKLIRRGSVYWYQFRACGAWDVIVKGEEPGGSAALRRRGIISGSMTSKS